MSIKRFVPLLLSTALLLTLGCSKKGESAPAAQPEPSVPKIVAVEDFFDWGSIRQGEIVDHKFQLRNTGSADLLISKVKSSCGCMAAVSSATTISPGQTGEISAKFDSAGRQGPSRKMISVFSNDPQKPELKLAMGGFITTDVEVTPAKLDLGEVSKGKKSTARFKLQVKDASRTKVSGVRVEDPQFVVKLVEGSAESDGEYEVAFLGSDKLGPLMVRIDISTEGSSVPAFKLPVNLVVVSDLKYARSMTFFKGDDDKYAPATIEVTSRSGKSVEVKEATDPSGGLTLEILASKGRKVEVRATVSDKAGSAPPRGKVVLATTNKDEPSIEIEYMIAKGKRPVLMPMAKAKPASKAN
ncbi:MAG: DUF1573 domain-containing protein [Myxococcota bacterium]|jgi:hypothetical protein|nr:DUF1573 domain-containing protein [Myxococcota bacterium]